MIHLIIRDRALIVLNNRSGTWLSPFFEPLSYDFDPYDGTLEDLGLPYSSEKPISVSPSQESEIHSPAPIDKDHEPLSQNTTSSICTLRDSEGKDIWVSAEAKLNGSFFFADDGNTTSPPAQLTCYRRNIFGISGSISFPSSPRRILDVNGEETAISGAEVCVSAFESTQMNATELVQVPIRAPGSDLQVTEQNSVVIPLFSEMSPEQGHNPRSTYTTYPFEWKRLQFRKATANSK